QGVALAAEHDDMRARSVGMRLFVSADRELRNVARNGAPCHIEPDVAAASPALLGADQRKVDSVRGEVRCQQKSSLLTLGAEIVGFAGETVLEIVCCVEDECEIAIKVEHGWTIGGRDETHRSRA